MGRVLKTAIRALAKIIYSVLVFHNYDYFYFMWFKWASI